MSTVWITIAVLAAGTVAIKAVGPVALGGRQLPLRLEGVVARLAPSLLAALVVVDTFGGERTLTIDETAAGLLAAGAALVARLPMFAVVVIAAATTAALRALV
jgi:Branched-chain amino acid transport protein (AzlD)